MLNIKGIFQQSKIARRIFYLFIASSLLPIAILAFFSLRQVDSLTTKNIESTLRQNAKSYGLSVNERLLLLDDKLSFHIATLEQTATANNRPKKLDGFTKLHLFELSNTRYQANNHLPPILKSERAVLRAGQSLLLTTQGVNRPAQLYLLRAINKTGLIIAGLVDNKAVWGHPDTFDFSQGLCIYGAKNELFFCTQTQLGDQLKSIESEWDKTATGNTEWVGDGQNLFIGFWKLFLKPKFHYPTITIVVTSDKKIAFEAVSGLRNIFITISLLTLITIAFLSTFRIRRYLTPVGELMSGINRIANNDFKHPVVVKTDDEFQQLAKSFNSMATTISTQFEFLTLLSEIDELILSNRGVKDIFPPFATQAKMVFHSEMICFAMIGGPNRELIDLYSEEIDQIHGISITSQAILLSEKNELEGKKSITLQKGDKNLPGYLRAVMTEELRSLALIPIQSDGELAAILVFGFVAPEIAPAILSQLREMGDRFSIALEKSSWEEKLYRQAHYDPLTQLPNRQLLYDRLLQEIKRATRDNSYFSLMFMDLDRFKTINDSLGHSSGDKLLKEVSRRLSHELRDEDTVSRLGGDEFIILLSTVNNQKSLYSQTSFVAKKIMAAIVEPYSIDNQEIHVSASIGIASFPTSGRDIETLIKNADSAMYHAKAEGRNNFQFYSDELNAKAMRQLIMETDLHNAITDSQFELYYQPKVDASTGEILGAEALIRWNHPVDGLISPFEFIPLAEETGLITQIGDWTIREACQQNRKWQRADLPKITISVNITPTQFQQKDLVGTVKNSLANAQLQPTFLDLEILEGTAMDDAGQTIETLNQLKSMGVSISIDDYGTGFSTLSYIKQFPVDNLKIDRSFIQNLVDDEGDKAIVASTIMLANKLGLRVVAEGVEDEQQLAWLQSVNCDEIQGYYFSRPVPAAEFAKLLRDRVIRPEQFSSRFNGQSTQLRVGSSTPTLS